VGVEAQADREASRALYARVVSDPGWILSVSEEITDAIHADLPELDRAQGIRVGTYASTESVLRQLAEMVALGHDPAEAGLPAAAIEYAREFVRRGVTIDALLRSYHIGHATFFGRYAARLHEQLTDDAQLASGMELGATWTFDYMQALTRSLVTRYAEERDRWVRSATAMRTETVRALLAGEPLDAAAAGQRLRYELDRQHLAYVVWSVQETPGEEFAGLERAALELAHSVGCSSALVVPLGRQLVAAWVGSRGHDPEVPGTFAIDSPAGEEMLAAFGEPAHGLLGFSKSHREAMHARRVATLSGRRAGSVTRFQAIALTALASVDPLLAREFVAEELGALAARDDDTMRLAATLRAYLEEHSSPRRTAHRLGVHENTVKHRVKHINEILGRPVDDRVGELLVALRLARLGGLDSEHG
jgi:PucR C-terminal helix-turn-helix domain/GGDEF-like domain